MHIYMTFAVLPFVAHIVSCEIIKEPAKDMKQAKTTLKPTTGQALIKTTSEVPSILLKQGYIPDKTPTSRITNQPEVRGEHIRRYEMLLNDPPHSLTKLAKTLSLGFDPYFSKDYFEPFERRPRPVTLVAFRKKGYAARHTVKNSKNSYEVAEQQSPFNEVGSFWQNEA